MRFCAAGHEFRIPASGRHYLTAALAAVAVGLEVGMSPGRMAEVLREFKTREGRCQIKQIGPWTIIDDSYNANPASMRAACQLMTAWQTGHKKIVIVGDMLELGDEATRYHHELGAQFAGAGIDCLLAHGDNAREFELMVEGGMTRTRRQRPRRDRGGLCRRHGSASAGRVFAV